MQERGGADTTTINDLTGTDASSVTLDLGLVDGAADQVHVNGTTGDDIVSIAGSASVVTVTGLAATVAVNSPEFAHDLLAVNTLTGDDVVTVTGGAQELINMLVNGWSF